MEYSQLSEILKSINGCTFASLDCETKPMAGVRKVTKGESVILFTNKTGSGYEKMVKRRLKEVGKNPDDFVLGDLAWGERLPDTPVIIHKGKYYLQTVTLRPGVSDYYIGETKVDPVYLGIKDRGTNQGLPRGKEVLVRTYSLDSIKQIKLLGETIPPDGAKKKQKLKLKM